MKDLVVIGAGPGGYVAAIRAAQLGMKVAIVEKDNFGGTCLNYGCIPTKALYKNAQVINYMKHGEDFGIELSSYKLNMNKVQDRKQNIVNQLTSGVEYLLKANKIEIIKGQARILRKGEVEVVSSAGEKSTILASKIIIATGSKSSKLSIPGIDLPNIITSKEALEMNRVPKDIVIVGGGVIGIEFAGIYNSFGSKVTVVEYMKDIIPNMDKEITFKLQQLLEKQGIKFILNAKVEKFQKNQSGLSVEVNVSGESQSISCEQVLIATGRQMYVEELGLDEVGITYNSKGIKVDENYETNIKGIYAIGDVTGRVMLAHVASEEGKVVVERMIGEKVSVDYELIPNAIFTFPDVASIGISEEEAKSQKLDYIVSRYQFSGNGKALTMNDAQGMIKVIAANDASKLLGVHIIGPNASDLIAEAAIAMNGMFTVNEVANVMHGHPTLSEAFEEAVSNIVGKAIHMPPVKKK